MKKVFVVWMAWSCVIGWAQAPDYVPTDGLSAWYDFNANLIEDNQTLYSFRHTGAIDVFKRTGSLTVLQQAMGHASLAVSLGYLRNLEVPILKVEDMPKLA